MALVVCIEKIILTRLCLSSHEEGEYVVVLAKSDKVRYKIQEFLFSVGFSKTYNISYMSYFPT